MKALAFVLLLSAGAVQAAPAQTYGFDTSDLEPGEARRFTVEGTVTVTLRRDGEVRRVTLERMGMINHYTLEPVGGELQVTRRQVEQGTVISPHRIIVDGVTLEDAVLKIPPPRGTAMVYICPKDQTMLRVPHSNHDGEFKCPVDGTPMKPSSRPSSPYFLLH